MEKQKVFSLPFPIFVVFECHLLANYSLLTTVGIFGVGPRCRRWPRKRDFGGTILSTNGFHIYLLISGYHQSVGLYTKKTGYLDRRKTESVYILLYN